MIHTENKGVCNGLKPSVYLQTSNHFVSREKTCIHF